MNRRRPAPPSAAPVNAPIPADLPSALPAGTVTFGDYQKWSVSPVELVEMNPIGAGYFGDWQPLNPTRNNPPRLGPSWIAAWHIDWRNHVPAK